MAEGRRVFLFLLSAIPFVTISILSWLELRLRYMHHLGALLRGHTFHCSKRCVTVKHLGRSRSKYS